MDPTMLAAITAGQVAEYMSELDRERALRQHPRETSRPTRWQRLRAWRLRDRATAPEACLDRTAAEAC